MPKPSKRMAARQAALAKKKKRGAPKQPQANQEPETEREADPVAAASFPRDETAQAPVNLPEFELPSKAARATPRTAVGRPASGQTKRRLAPAMPYLKGDLRRTGMLATMLLITLIVLAFIIG